MIYTYKISGTTCDNCEAKVEKILSAIDGVSQVKLDVQNEVVKITVEKHISSSRFHQALKETKYHII